MRIRSLLLAATAAGMAYRYLNNKRVGAADTQEEPQTAFAFDQDQDQTQAESGVSAAAADSLNPAEHLSGQGLQGSDGFRNASSEGGRGTIPGMVDFTRGA